MALASFLPVVSFSERFATCLKEDYGEFYGFQAEHAAS